MNVQETQMKRLLKHLFLMMVIISIILLYNLLNIGCPFRFLFGISCPTCGMTRALLSLLKFDFAASLCYNPMTVFMIAAIFLGIHKQLFRKEKVINSIVIVISVIAFVIYLLKLLKYH